MAEKLTPHRETLSVCWAKAVAHGKMGCNHLMLQAKEVGSGKIDFGPIATSMMLCEDMKLEEAFLNMRSVWNYRFDGDDLILEQNGKTMRLRREP